LKEEWPIWRVWLTGKESFEVIISDWTFDDLVRANTVLDIQEAINEALTEEK